MGVFDAIKFRKESYPYRYRFNNFIDIYNDLSNKIYSQRNIPIEQIKICKELISHSNIIFQNDDILYGNTRIFIKEDIKKQIDQELFKCMIKKKDAVK